MNGWISVKNRMPVTGSLCLVVCWNTVQHISYRRVGIGFACEHGYAWDMASGEGDSIPDHEVTHWMYLPEPPK